MHSFALHAGNAKVIATSKARNDPQALILEMELVITEEILVSSIAIKPRGDVGASDNIIVNDNH